MQQSITAAEAPPAVKDKAKSRPRLSRSLEGAASRRPRWKVKEFQKAKAVNSRVVALRRELGVQQLKNAAPPKFQSPGKVSTASQAKPELQEAFTQYDAKDVRKKRSMKKRIIALFSCVRP